MTHETRQVLETPPETVDLIERPFEAHDLMHVDASAASQRAACVSGIGAAEAGPVSSDALVCEWQCRYREPGARGTPAFESVRNDGSGRRHGEPAVPLGACRIFREVIGCIRSMLLCFHEISPV